MESFLVGLNKSINCFNSSISPFIVFGYTTLTLPYFLGQLLYLLFGFYLVSIFAQETSLIFYLFRDCYIYFSPLFILSCLKFYNPFFFRNLHDVSIFFILVKYLSKYVCKLYLIYFNCLRTYLCWVVL